MHLNLEGCRESLLRVVAAGIQHCVTWQMTSSLRAEALEASSYLSRAEQAEDSPHSSHSLRCGATTALSASLSGELEGFEQRWATFLYRSNGKAERSKAILQTLAKGSFVYVASVEWSLKYTLHLFKQVQFHGNMFAWRALLESPSLTVCVLWLFSDS